LGQVHRIHPNRDEGQSENPRALRLADIRAKIRLQIQDSAGNISRAKAHDMGQSFLPTMAASTVVRFATGETLSPSSWTIRMMTQQAGMDVWLLPQGAAKPAGAIRFE